MLPTHIRNEVVRRLRDGADLPQPALSQLKLDAAQPPIEPDDVLEIGPKTIELPGEGDVVHGNVPFSLTITVLGHIETIDMRARFATTLYDDEDRRTGEPLRILARTDLAIDMLDWRDPEGRHPRTGDRIRLSVPRWVQVDLWNVLPDEALQTIDELMEARAVELEVASQSTA